MDLELDMPHGNPRAATVRIDGELVTDITRIQFDGSLDAPVIVILHRYADKLVLRGTFEEVKGWEDPDSDPPGDVKKWQNIYKKQYEDNPR
jgi:hypothetical protein